MDKDKIFVPDVPLLTALRSHFRQSGLRDRDMRYAAPHLCRNLSRGTEKNLGRKLLAAALGDMGIKNGVEIGVMQGRSARVWVSRCPDLHLVCIDPYIEARREPHYEKAKKTLAGPNFTLLRCTSMEGLPEVEDCSLDFVHIDGAHDFDNVCMDIIQWSKKLKKGGIMACHDFHIGKNFGVIEAVRSYVACHKINPWYVVEDPQPTAFWQKP